jgi:hypothetical protein
VRELESKNAIGRKKLMQSLFDHLHQTGIKAELLKEPAINSLGISVLESVIRLKEQNLDNISLAGIEGGSCAAPGNIMRFQYKVHLDKDLSPDTITDIYAVTRVIKEGKVLNLFGRKVVGGYLDWPKASGDLKTGPGDCR